MSEQQERPPLATARAPEDIRRAGKLVAKQAGGNTVASFFNANKETLKALLPAHMTPERMMKIALGALRTTPKLMDCTIESLFGSVVVCAQMGLEPNTPQGHIYLIPFENRRKQTTEVQVIVGYKGLIDLARRSGQIESLCARVIYERDELDIDYGTANKLGHKPFLGGDPGRIIGFSAIAKLKGGGEQFEFMSVAEINAIRDGSQGYQTAKRFNKTNTPWITNYVEMGKKTVVRRLMKYLPSSIELASAVALDGRAEVGEAQSLGRVFDGDFTVLPSGEDGGADEDDAAEGDDEPAPQKTAPTKSAAKPKPEPKQAQATTPHDPDTGVVIEDETAQTKRAAPASPASDDDDEDLFAAT